jgi:hypothetical protein
MCVRRHAQLAQDQAQLANSTELNRYAAQWVLENG